MGHEAAGEGKGGGRHIANLPLLPSSKPGSDFRESHDVMASCDVMASPSQAVVLPLASPLLQRLVATSCVLAAAIEKYYFEVLGFYCVMSASVDKEWW